MFRIKFVILSTLYISLCDAYYVAKKEGESCQFETNEIIRGVCRKIFDCPYALNLINVEEKKAPMCRWNGTMRIVCCPTNDLRPIEMTKYATEAESTAIQNAQRTQASETPEPAECPALPRPTLRTKTQHLAWSKCLDYQRYSNRCISINKQKTIYKRVSTCVTIDRSYEDQIMGGYPALPTEFPHLAVLGFKDKYDGGITWNGAGSLISDKFILTAAHILYEFGEVKYAMMGALNKTDVKTGVIFNVIRTISYNKYDVDSNKDDIVLLELNEKVTFNEFIHPACLPVPGRKLETERIIAGWGEMNERKEQSNILLTTNVIEYPRYCLTRFNRTTFDRRTMRCIGGNMENTDVLKGNHHTRTCASLIEAPVPSTGPWRSYTFQHFPYNAHYVNHNDAVEINSENNDATTYSYNNLILGDSGGPLMALLLNLKCSYSIEGIASKNPNGRSDSVHIYTNVSKYLEWIVQNIWSDEWTNAEPLDVRFDY